MNAAGSGIQDELYKRHRGGLREGDIAVTDGYDLSCRCVFHGALRGYNPGENFWVNKLYLFLQKEKRENYIIINLKTRKLEFVC